MRSRNLLLGVLAVLLLAIGGGAFAYVTFLQGDNVARLALPAIGVGGASQGSGGGRGSLGPSLAPAPAASIDAASVPGSWSVAADSIAGYRVRERLASLTADSDAVGRTNAITGTVTIAS